jgi:hypothetical protein
VCLWDGFEIVLAQNDSDAGNILLVHLVDSEGHLYAADPLLVTQLHQYRVFRAAGTNTLVENLQEIHAVPSAIIRRARRWRPPPVGRSNRGHVPSKDFTDRFVSGKLMRSHFMDRSKAAIEPTDAPIIPLIVVRHAPSTLEPSAPETARSSARPRPLCMAS